ncbi:MAG: complex I subunit 5 family protein, partial [Candidatus Thermoplasmatota archaeon]|nr:complex I subunit 5 family protein [Candidatus Thermoplasmatota archaeon]
MMWCLALPFAGGFLAYLAGRKSEKARDAIAVATSVATFICIFLFCKPDGSIDGLSYTIALITSFVWMIATFYSLEYMKHEHKRNRFYLFLLLSLGADLGVLFSSNLIMLYLFFELLTLFSSVLVVHEESAEAIKALKKYLYLGIAGGLSLLGGIILFYNVTGSLALDPSILELESAGWIKYLIGAMMIAGFGVKAGIFPLHVWLPKAHPVAPTPASALLSGIMVKVGIYGIMRTIFLFSPFNATTATIAHWLLWIGLITMLVGWVLALTQDHIKRLLAYSTISQIGYIIVGIGSLGLLGAEGAIGMAGALYHVVNHAFYKSALFLIAGAIIYRTGETNMSRLGGLSRDMPVLTALAMIAFLGIVAFPGFNGFASDTLLHHALVEASETIGAIDLEFALLLFTVNAGGTLAYYLKFITFTFFGENKREKKTSEPPLIMLISIAALVIFIPLIGIFPNFVLESLIIPSLEGFDAHAVEHLYHMQFFTLENVTNVSVSLMIGALIFFVSKSLKLMERTCAFGVDSLYNLTARSFIWLCREISGFASALERAYLVIARSFIL